jgi:hypothetical protein
VGGRGVYFLEGAAQRSWLLRPYSGNIDERSALELLIEKAQEVRKASPHLAKAQAFERTFLANRIWPSASSPSALRSSASAESPEPLEGIKAFMSTEHAKSESSRATMRIITRLVEVLIHGEPRTQHPPKNHP